MIRIEEMSISRADAMERCFNLGEKFIEHFNKIINSGGINDPNFVHHCGEMQAWYDNVKKIRLRQNNKIITDINLMDWFFTAMGNPEELIIKGYDNLYSRFATYLLFDKNKKVLDALMEAIKENEKETGNE